jgi:hypothetical protein
MSQAPIATPCYILLGDKPAWDFLLSLDKKMRAKMASMVSLL